MTGVSRQKQKLLTMKKLFETKTDEKHTITGNRLIEILGDYGIKAERKISMTISRPSATAEWILR